MGMPDPETESMTEREPQAFTPASAPRRADEVDLAPLEQEPVVPNDPNDPLEGIPHIPADVAGGVSESEVTDRNQSAKPVPNHDTGQSQHPPASTAP